MSAFIVEDSTINNIVAFLAEQQESGDLHSINFYGLPSWVPLIDEESKTIFAQALFDMNVESVEQRYGKGCEGTLNFLYHRVTSPVAIRAYSALRCFLYHSFEGDVYKTPLYKTMEEISARIAHSIVSASKAYKTAPWG